MTAAEALASMREDIDALEAKNVVKPGHIRRRRAEVEAIADELESMQKAMFDLSEANDRLQRMVDHEALQLGMLANMLTILGIPWERRLAAANEHEAEVMRRAARIACAHNPRNTPDHNTPKWTLLAAMRNAILAARIELQLATITPHIHGQLQAEGRAA